MDIFVLLLELFGISGPAGKSTPVAASFIRVIGLLLTLLVVFIALHTGQLAWLLLLVLTLPMLASRGVAKESADAVSPGGGETATDVRETIRGIGLFLMLAAVLVALLTARPAWLWLWVLSLPMLTYRTGASWAVWFVRVVGFLFLAAAAFVFLSYPMVKDSRFISLWFLAVGIPMIVYRRRIPSNKEQEISNNE